MTVGRVSAEYHSPSFGTNLVRASSTSAPSTPAAPQSDHAVPGLTRLATPPVVSFATRSGSGMASGQPRVLQQDASVAMAPSMGNGALLPSKPPKTFRKESRSTTPALTGQSAAVSS